MVRLNVSIGDSHSCYFRETTGCRYAAAVHGTPGTTARKDMWSERQFNINTTNGLAHVATRRGLAPFALSAELLLFFMQPNERVRRDVTGVKAALGWASLPRPVLAVYVFGDGVRHVGALAWVQGNVSSVQCRRGAARSAQHAGVVARP